MVLRQVIIYKQNGQWNNLYETGKSSIICKVQD